MSRKNSNLIVCPICGAEYLPAEIFVPKYFFGTPHDIRKDEDGKFLICDGREMDLHENYRCDKCNTALSIEASISFKVTEDVDIFKDDSF